MKSLSTAAAALVIVGGAALFLQSSPSAFGEVIKKLREARSFSYVKQIEIEGKPKPIEVKIMVAEDGRQRQEMAGGTVSIMDPSHQIRLTLITPSKTALVSEPQELPPGSPENHPIQWLEDLKDHGDQPDKSLGKKVLDGRSVEGFVVMQGQYAYTIWIDGRTKELVQVEHEMPVKGTSITKVVMSDFRFNEELDESLFSYDVPEGYKTITQKRFDIPKSAGLEQDMVEALRGFTRKSAGKFPKSITESGEWAILYSKDSKDGQLDKETMEVLSHLGSIMPNLIGLPKDDYQYLGSGKTVDDKRCIVFWYKNKDAKFRAIYNDLTISDVEEKAVR
jgi:outer membrane lipoprotein-sorting protein